MQRYNPGDGIFIIPKFSHLYSDVAAVVIKVKADPFRPMFNDYTLEFPDRSTARLFEFQIIEAAPDFDTLIANCTFDGQHSDGTINTRGQMSARRILLETPVFHVDMKIRTIESSGPSILGQVLERGTNNQVGGLAVSLLREAMPVDATVSDNLGAFEFRDVPRGAINILIAIPRHAARIFGTFWA